MKGFIACLCFGGLCGIAGTTALAVESEGFRNLAQINKDELAIIQKQEETLNEQGKELAQAKEITETITKENEQIKADKTALSAELETAKADLETALANGELQESEIAEKQEKITELENQIIEKEREVILNQTLVNTIKQHRLLYNFKNITVLDLINDFNNKIVVQNNSSLGLTEPGYYDHYSSNGTRGNIIYFDGIKLYKVISTNMREILSFEYDSTKHCVNTNEGNIKQITYFVKKNNYLETVNQIDFEYIKNVDSETFDLKNGKGKVLQIGDMFKLDIGYGNKPVLIDETNTYEITYCNGLSLSKAITLINKNDISKSVVINKIDDILSYYYISDTATTYTDIELVEEIRIEEVGINADDYYLGDADIAYQIVSNGNMITFGKTSNTFSGACIYNILSSSSLFQFNILDYLNVYDKNGNLFLVCEATFDNYISETFENIHINLFNENGEEIQLSDIENSWEKNYQVIALGLPNYEYDENNVLTYLQISLQVFPAE